MTHTPAVGPISAVVDDALGDHDAVGLVEQMQRGAVSATELVDAAIGRIEAVDPALNAVAFRAYDRAREQARSADVGTDFAGSGFFAGLPTLVKDNCDVAGMPKLEGTDAWVGRPAKQDGDFASMYLGTGLIALGKSRLSEYGFLPTAEHPRLGPVHNPWDTRYSSGASSAGAAALVAAGALPIAHANDGGGSIRIPASVCGLVGLKPTRGRLAQDKTFREMPVRIISDGVLTRSVRDTAAFFRECEYSFRALKLPPIGDVRSPGPKRLKVAVITSAMGQEASPEVRDLTLKTAALLTELGHTVVEDPTPPVDRRFRDDFLIYWSTLALVLLRTGRLTHGRSWDPSRHDPFTLGLARFAARHVHRLPGAVRRLRRSSAITAEYFGRYDVLLAPTLATQTPLLGHIGPQLSYDEALERTLDWIAFTPLQNATGDPAISLPLATTAAGLPQGMMFGAGAGQEATLLRLAFELEEAVAFPRMPRAASS